MPASTHIAVLDHDRDLAGDLSTEQFARARLRVRAPALHYPKGPWEGEPIGSPATGILGLLIVEGLLVRKVSVGSRACAELLGPGDILQPWLRVGDDSSVGLEVDWNAAEQLTVALLDRDFAVAAGPWPEIVATVAQRIMTRTHWLAFQLALCHIRRVEDRLLLVLWHTADRWGKVTPRGVEITIALPHRLLGFMVGARRPAVTLALSELTAAGTVERRARSHWVLHGGPPAAYHQASRDAAHRRLDSREGEIRPDEDELGANGPPA